MNRIRLGVVLETAGLPVRQAFEAAARAGVSGVQADAVGDLDPTRLSETGRRELRTLLRGTNLEFTALNCPLRRGLDSPEQLQVRLEHLAKVLQLAADLGPRVVLMPMPRLPTKDELTTPRGLTLRESLSFLAVAADRVGVSVALEPGLDSAAATRDYLDTFDTGSLAVNFDPANFLINGHDPVKSAVAFAGRIRHVNARDAQARTASGGAKEVAVGDGDIDWLVMLATLESVEYRDFVVIDRDNGVDRWPDVLAGVKFLRRFVPAS